MTTFHGYPVPSDSHPERPWWVFDRRALVLRRTDGRVVSIAEAGSAVFDVLAEIDREHPMPCPEPMCGQVWRWPTAMVDPGRRGERLHGGTTTMIVHVDPVEVVGGEVIASDAICAAGMRWRFDPGDDSVNAWPPPGATLVHGPGSPWMAAGDDDAP